MAEIEISVVFFAKAKDFVKQSSGTLKVAQALPIEELTSTLLQRYPGLEKLGGAFVLALNEEYIESGIVELTEGDELAVIPPISGG